jgi:photosystem II stability/assembly factor-like uncharacterized protein
LKDVHTNSRGEIWAVGINGLLLNSRNKGNDWSVKVLNGGSGDLQCIHFTDLHEGWIGSTAGLFHTFDGGQNWYLQQISRLYEFGVEAISFNGPREGWAITSIYDSSLTSLIFHTCDGGQKWKMLDFKISDHLLDVFAMSTGDAWFVGEDGTVLRLSTHGERMSRINLE